MVTMASPMIRVPEALKEVIQKLADIHRKGDKRREVEAGLHRLLVELQELEIVSPTFKGDNKAEEEEMANSLSGDTDDMDDNSLDDTADSTSDNKLDNVSDSTGDDISDNKSVSKPVDSTPDPSANINVMEVVSRLEILEEKLAALDPTSRSFEVDKDTLEEKRKSETSQD
jgi:hypothetical protein